MKKCLLIFFALFICFACSEDQIEQYKGDNDSIVSFTLQEWSSYTETYYDRETLNAGFKNKPDLQKSDIACKATISGAISNKDRVINLKFVGDFNENTQINLPKEVIVPAGKVSAIFTITVMRPAEEDSNLENIIYVTVDELGSYQLSRPICFINAEI